MFEKATRMKLRFEYRGLISVEDLWDLSLTQLDTIYKKLSAEIKNRVEDSLLEEEKPDDEATLKVEIVKHIFGVKKSEQNARKAEVARRQQKARIMEILAEKQDEGLKGKSEEELLKMLEEL